MKKSILYLLFLSAAFLSCENKDDSVFEESADARLNAALASYEKQLIEAPYGWNAVIYPKSGGSYGFYFKFDDKNRVVMYSDFSDEAAAKSKESSYRLKALQTPALIFDTYSYLHVLADPDEEVSGGERGQGLASDFEFSIFPDSVKADGMTLVGRQNQSRLVLTKATQAQATAFANGDLAKALVFNNISKLQVYFKRVTLGGVTYEIAFNPGTRNLKMTWLEGALSKSFSTKYYYSSAGLVFVSPLVNGAQTINGFTNITWNPNSMQVGVTGGGLNGTVVTAIRPLAIDLEAAKRWWQAPVESGRYWRSWDGFHVNGVDDAFKVKTLTLNGAEFVYYIYEPAVNTRYDLFAPIFYADQELTLDYWYAPNTPTFARDGRIIFTELGTTGSVPGTGPAADTKTALYETNGFYLIQTSEDTYDMVGAKDAKTWITWE